MLRESESSSEAAFRCCCSCCCGFVAVVMFVVVFILAVGFRILPLASSMTGEHSRRAPNI